MTNITNVTTTINPVVVAGITKPVILTIPPTRSVSVVDIQSTLTITPAMTTVKAAPQNTQTVSIHAHAPPVSDTSTITVIAGETLSGHRAVRVHAGMAFYCDADLPAQAGTALGITSGAAVVGDSVSVQLSGSITEAAWDWEEGAVFVGSAGHITQIPFGAFIQQIGVAISASTIQINPQLAIIRSV